MSTRSLEDRIAELEAANRRLTESEARARSYIEHAPTAVFVTDERGRYLEFNPAALRLLGYDAETLATLTIFDTIVDCDRQRMLADFATLAVCGQVEQEYRLRTADGRSLWVQVRAVRLSDTRFFGFCQDVTGRKQAEDALQRSAQALRQAQSLARLGSYEYDIAADRWTSSEVLDQIFGIDAVFPRTVAGWLEIVHPDQRAGMRQYVEGVISQLHPFDKEYRIVRIHDGAPRWVHGLGRIECDPAGNPRHLLGTIQDITERRMTAEALEQARDYAESANVAKGRFLASMSHELRTPLNAIIGFAELLAADESQPDRLEQFEMIRQSGKNLLRLIRDILDLSKIESGVIRIERTSFDLESELSSIARLFQQEARRKGLALSVTVAPNIPRSLHGDAGLLHQVLLNLVGNALKFTHQGRIEISASACGPIQNEAGLVILFQVRDTGIGIRPENRSRIFEMFEQEDNSFTRKFSGAGLGLAISKRLVSLMNGQIWLDPHQDAGANFCFTAEMEIVDPQAPASEAAPPAGAALPMAGQRVLVVEDDLYNQKLFCQLIKKIGGRFDVAEDGAAALALLQDQSFDLILMDIQLPVLSGAELTRRIRTGSVPGCAAHIPIIAVTAHAMSGDREHFLDLGISDYISKPIDTGRLVAAITLCLNRPQPASTSAD